MSKPGILFIKHYSTNAKFILNDADILKEKFTVDVYVSNTKNNFTIIFSLLGQFFHHLLNIRKYKLIYIWFADYHSFIPVMFGKIFGVKSIIAIGGYDATCIPEINMGAFIENSFKKKIRSYMTKFSLRNADKILVVDDSLIKNTNTYIYSGEENKKPLEDGILNFIPDIKNKIEVVYTGFDENYFKRDENIPKERFILSVGFTPDDNEFRRKGFDMLIEAAEIMKEEKFVLIGLNEKQIKEFEKKKIANVKVMNSVSMDELRKYYNKAKVFAQLSLFEGQPNSLCEAMMYECIPVGSNVNGIPRVIGNTGFIVDKKNVYEITEKLLQALNSPDELGFSARKRITENFSLERRKDSILRIVSDLISS